MSPRFDLERCRLPGRQVLPLDTGLQIGKFAALRDGL